MSGNKNGSQQRIGLQEAISGLREELIESINSAQEKELLFNVEEITMEFQIEVELNVEAKGGIKVYVAEIGLDGTLKNKNVHKVVISLKPEQNNGINPQIGSKDKPKLI
jgi:Trypsin-co-occurring domain 2